MTSWVTGAAGFIGHHLVAQLAQDGANPAGIGIGTPTPGLPWVEGALSLASFDRLAEQTGIPEAIFHLAGGASVGASLADPLGDFELTMIGTAQLLEWVRLRAPNAAIVAISSAAVYGDGHNVAITQTARTNPFSPYGANKLMMEQCLRSYGSSFGIKSVIARLFSVYGPGLRKQLLWDICTRLAAGTTALELGGSGNELRDWTHVGDVCRALRALPQFADSTASVVNLGSGIATPISAIAALVTDRFEQPTTVSFSGRSRAGDPQQLVAMVEPFRGWQPDWPTELAAGIGGYVDWFKVVAAS